MTIFYSPSKKGFYDDKFNYPSLPTDLVEVGAVEHRNLLKEINSNNKVIVVVDGAITLQEKPLTEITQTWQTVRLTRNMLLNDSDHTQLPDYPADLKTQWASYRQLLRDIPQTYENATDVVWPTKPAP